MPVTCTWRSSNVPSVKKELRAEIGLRFIILFLQKMAAGFSGLWRIKDELNGRRRESPADEI